MAKKAKKRTGKKAYFSRKEETAATPKEETVVTPEEDMVPESEPGFSVEPFAELEPKLASEPPTRSPSQILLAMGTVKGGPAFSVVRTVQAGGWTATVWTPDAATPFGIGLVAQTKFDKDATEDDLAKWVKEQMDTVKKTESHDYASPAQIAKELGWPQGE